MLLLLQAFVVFSLWTHSKIFSVNFVLAQDFKASAAPPGVSLNNVSSSPAFLGLPHEAGSSTKDSDLNSTSTSVVDSDSKLVEAAHNSSFRNARQLYFQPNIGYLQAFGEGSKCITTTGFSGSCVSFRGCHPYQRYGRHLALLTVRQWPLTAPPMNPEYCTFYDHYGWPNSGICCTSELSNGVGHFGPVPAWPSVVQPVQQQPTFIVQAERPIQGRPPSPEAPTVEEEPEVVDVDDEQYSNAEMDNNSHTKNDSDLDASANVDPTEDSDTDVLENSPDFQDVNNVAYDPINESDEKPSTPVLYDDYRYQWPHFTDVQQHWPPPLPTHPPSTAQWPPPIPTHPPNHHYPTHPPSPAQDTSTLVTNHNTTRRTSTSLRPTTTRRPSRPIYPTYPFYPTFRPNPTTGTKPRPPATTTTTTITTRRPPTSEATSSLGLPLQCGMKNAVSPDQERIVGGTNASPNEFPWIAVLFRAGRQFCGGSLITKSHILTAAHCVARMTSWDVAAITVHLGDYDIRNNFEVKHVERRVKRLVRHKGFQFNTLHNDVAILTLSDPIRFTHEIQPICLPVSSAQQARSYSGHVATVAGWGSLHENGPQPSILQKVSIPIWSNPECARKYGRAAPAGIISSMLCAGQTARDSCSGDSGGPLIVKEGGRYTQVGIVSWGIGCGKGQYPGVYTRVTSLLPWIYKNIKQ